MLSFTKIAVWYCYHYDNDNRNELVTRQLGWRRCDAMCVAVRFKRYFRADSQNQTLPLYLVLDLRRTIHTLYQTKKMGFLFLVVMACLINLFMLSRIMNYQGQYKV